MFKGNILKLFIVLFCFSSCDSFDDSDSTTVHSTTVSQTAVTTKQVSVSCQWDLLGPKKSKCNDQTFCVGSVSCSPSGPFLKLVICKEQHCSTPQSCIADQSPDTAFCGWQLGSKIQ